MLAQLTAKLQIKHKLQVKTLRATHADSHYYCAALFKYAKGVVMKLVKFISKAQPGMLVRFASMDDKAKVSKALILINCVKTCTEYV